MRQHEETLKMVQLTHENISMVEKLDEVRESIIRFRKDHPEFLSEGMDARLEVSILQLKQCRRNVNDIGHSLDMELDRVMNEETDPRSYKSIESSKQMITAETDRQCRLLFPKNGWESKAKVIWHPKNFIRPTQDQTGIIINYYSDWKFRVFDADPLTGEVMKGTRPKVIDIIDFVDMVNTANEMLSYEPLVPEKKLLKNNSLIKANGMHL